MHQESSGLDGALHRLEAGDLAQLQADRLTGRI